VDATRGRRLCRIAVSTGSRRTARSGRRCCRSRASLAADDFPAVPNGAYIASVTSADDELDLTGLSALYEQHPAGDHITRYTATGHYFYVLNSGNAVNFLHGACVGPFIYLVQAEILAALSLLAAGDRGPGLHECPDTIRHRIASTWLKVFNGEP
jgi:adenosylhomocysteinase